MPKFTPIQRDFWSADRVQAFVTAKSQANKLSLGLTALRLRFNSASSGQRIAGGITGGTYDPPKVPNDQGRGSL